MNVSKQKSKALNIALWVAQVLLAASLLWAASMKLFQPVQTLAAMWPWVGQVPNSLVKITGIVDLLGGLGLVLPGLLKIKPRLTFWAATGIIILMIVASAYHISRREASFIIPNMVFAVMAIFVAWGRK